MEVPSSSLGTQPIGEVSEALDGVYQLKLPVPFPLKFIASYLVPGDEGWTVVDPGFDYPPAREAWETCASEIGLSLDEGVSQIIVTHLHPDHIGLARWMQERSGAPVYMLAGEIENARRVWDLRRDSKGFVEFMIRNGMDEQTAQATAGTTRLGIRLPDEISALHPGDVVTLGDHEMKVIHTEGHSDFHFILHDGRRHLLFAGDHILLRITPNIGLWTYTAPNPLERYLASLQSLKGLDVELVLPGHGPLFHDLDGRIDEIVHHHEERLDVMHESFDGEPATPLTIARRVFPEDLTDHQLRFAVAETLAHLEHLVVEKRAERVDGEVVYYHAT